MVYVSPGELDEYIAKLTHIEDCFDDYRDNDSVQRLEELKNEPEYQELMRKWLFCAKMPDVENALQMIITKTMPQYMLSPYSDIMLHCQRNWHNALRFVHLAYVYSGSFECVTNSRSFTLEEGCCCLFNAHVWKSTRALTEDSYMLNCIFSQSYLENILVRQFDQNFLFSDFMAQSFYADSSSEELLIFDARGNLMIKQAFAMSIYEHFERQPFFYETINCSIGLVFSQLLRIYATGHDSLHYMELGDNKLSDILNYIDANCAGITLADTAAFFHFHPNYLSRIIRQHTSLTFTEILQRTRIKKAASLLRNTGLPVASISQQVGYSNISHFYSVFKAEYNCTPADYRKRKI